MAFEIDGAGVKAGTRFWCYCRSCRAADIHLRGDETGLTQDKAVEIFHTTPDHLIIHKGREHLAAIRLTPKGPVRWYATCCGAPLWNTTKVPTIPFMGVVIRPDCHFPKAPELGKPKVVYTKFARKNCGAPTRDRGMALVIFSVFRRMPRAWLHRKNDPLVKADGHYIAQYRLMDKPARTLAFQVSDGSES